MWRKKGRTAAAAPALPRDAQCRDDRGLQLYTQGRSKGGDHVQAAGPRSSGTVHLCGPPPPERKHQALIRDPGGGPHATGSGWGCQTTEASGTTFVTERTFSVGKGEGGSGWARGLPCLEGPLRLYRPTRARASGPEGTAAALGTAAGRPPGRDEVQDAAEEAGEP